MIELCNVTKTFNENTVNAKTVIREMNLVVDRGEFVTIIGSNGAGKTTLFNLIAGSISPSEGSVLLKGEAVTTQPEYKRAKSIGRIFQDPLKGTASAMTVEDNMMITYRKGFKWPKISLNSKMREFFKSQLVHLEMGLESRIKENVSSLSGGQRQALTLLMMVISEPDIVLLDEHTAALDPRNAAIVMGLTTHFIETYGLTTMMITHNMQHAIDYGSRLFMMDAGEIVVDVKGEAKQALTRQKLLDMFSQVRHQDFDSDEVLLSEGT